MISFNNKQHKDNVSFSADSGFKDEYSPNGEILLIFIYGPKKQMP
jgi:hypothetical protein